MENADRVLEKSIKYKEIIENVDDFLKEENKFLEKNKDYKNYMKKMYGSRFSNKKYIQIYKFYQLIRRSEKYCPYCNVPTREIRQVDHYLSKANFPSLSLVIKNLVPICKDCNELKGNYYSLNKEEQLIHPYYDEELENSFEYIECIVEENINIGFQFRIKKLENWSEVFYRRIKFHFKKLGIDKIYLADFSSAYASEITMFKNLYKINQSKDEVKMLMRLKSESYYEGIKMPWNYAGFKSLAENEWFFETLLPQLASEKES